MQNFCYFQQSFTGPAPLAVIVNYDNVANTADSTGTIGDLLYLMISRNGVWLELTNPEANTGSKQLSYNTTLQNGDTLCIRSSFDNFATYATDCKQIPTPQFGFVPVT